MDMEDVVTVDMSLNTLAVLISGLYVSNTGIAVEAIPPVVFIELAKKLMNYLPLNVDELVNENLIIAPIELFSESELEEYKDNAIFMEMVLGNITLVATARI